MDHEQYEVYFLQSRDGIKIGYTKNFESRFRALRTGNPGLEHITSIQTRCYKCLELELHHVLKRKRIDREFFNISIDDVRYIEKCWRDMDKDIICDSVKVVYLINRISFHFHNSDYTPTEPYYEPILSSKSSYFNSVCTTEFIHKHFFSYARYGTDMIDYNFAPHIEQFVHIFAPKIRYCITNYWINDSLYDRILALKRLFDRSLSDAMTIIERFNTPETISYALHTYLQDEIKKLVSTTKEYDIYEDEKSKPLIELAERQIADEEYTDIAAQIECIVGIRKEMERDMKCRMDARREKAKQRYKTQEKIMSCSTRISQYEDFCKQANMSCVIDGIPNELETSYINLHTGIVLLKQKEERICEEGLGTIPAEYFAIGYCKDGKIMSLDDDRKKVCKFNNIRMMTSSHIEEVETKLKAKEEEVRKLKAQLVVMKTLEPFIPDDTASKTDTDINWFSFSCHTE